MRTKRKPGRPRGAIRSSATRRLGRKELAIRTVVRRRGITLAQAAVEMGFPSLPGLFQAFDGDGELSGRRIRLWLARWDVR